jgi:hypothetical protein
MHKFTLLLTLFLFGFNLAFAQENRSSLINAKIKDGSILLGGSLGASYQQYSHDNRITKKRKPAT